MSNTLVFLHTPQSEKIVLVHVESMSFQISRDLVIISIPNSHISSIPQATKQKIEDISHSTQGHKFVMHA